MIPLLRGDNVSHYTISDGIKGSIDYFGPSTRLETYIGIATMYQAKKPSKYPNRPN